MSPGVTVISGASKIPRNEISLDSTTLLNLGSQVLSLRGSTTMKGSVLLTPFCSVSLGMKSYQPFVGVILLVVVSKETLGVYQAKSKAE